MTPDLIAQLRKALAFNEWRAHEEATNRWFMWPSRWQFQRGADWESARRAKVDEALVSVVEAVGMGAFHHNSCASNWYEENSTKPNWDGRGDHRLAKKCTCAHEKIDEALSILRAAVEG